MSRFVFLILLAFLGVFVQRCAKESPPEPSEEKSDLLDCDPSGFISRVTTECNPGQYLPPDLFCDYAYEGQRSLLEPTRHQNKYLCPEVRQVTFANAAGDFVSLAVEKTTGYFETQSNGACADDTDRETLICSDSESAWVTLRNQAAGLEFAVAMDVGERDPEWPARDFDRVIISLAKVSGEAAYSWPAIYYQVDPDGSRRLVTPHTYLAGRLELGGEEYLDVIYRRPPPGGSLLVGGLFQYDLWYPCLSRQGRDDLDLQRIQLTGCVARLLRRRRWRTPRWPR